MCVFVLEPLISMYCVLLSLKFVDGTGSVKKTKVSLKNGMSLQLPECNFQSVHLIEQSNTYLIRVSFIRLMA